MNSSGTESRLRAHVGALAGTIGERHFLRPRALSAAADYIVEEWRAQGYAPERETFTANGVGCANLVITRPGPTRRGPAGRRALRHGARQPRGGRQRQRRGRAPGAVARLRRARARAHGPLRRLRQRGAAVLLHRAHGQRRPRQGGAGARRADRAHGLAGDAGLLRRPARQPALPAAVPLVLPGPRQLPGLRRRPARAGSDAAQRRPHSGGLRPCRWRPAPPSAGFPGSAGATTPRSGAMATGHSWPPTRRFTATRTTTRPKTCRGPSITPGSLPPWTAWLRVSRSFRQTGVWCSARHCNISLLRGG